MEYFWKTLPRYPEQPARRSALWVTFITGAFAGVIVLAISAVTLDADKLTFNLLIWRLLALPVVAIMMAVACCNFWFSARGYREIALRSVYIENEQQWKRQATTSLRLAAHTSLFPVDDAALKMIKLEGEMPAKADFPLKLDVDYDEASGMNRTQKVIKRLLEQLDLSFIDSTRERPQVWLHINTPSEAMHRDIAAVIAAHSPMFKQSEIHYLDTLPESDFLEGWVWEHFQGYRLLIVVELHDGKELHLCEFATALLFSRQREISDGRVPVWCFSSMDTFPHMLDKNLDTLLSAEQVKPASLRHVWTGNLKGESLHLLTDALNENSAGVSIRHWHSMLLADTWSPAYPWLMLEWAASAIRHGQHAQMLAVQRSEGQKIHLLMINSEQPYIDLMTHEMQDQGCGILIRLISSQMLVVFTGILFYNCMVQGVDADKAFLLTLIFISIAMVAFIVASVVAWLEYDRLRSALYAYYSRE